MDVGMIIVLISYPLLYSHRDKNLALEMLEEIGLNLPCYPKGYVKPIRYIRKRYNIRLKLIPKYWYFILLLSVFYIFLAPINVVIYALSASFTWLSNLLWALFFVFMPLETIISVSVAFYMKHKVKIKRKEFVRQK